MTFFYIVIIFRINISMINEVIIFIACAAERIILAEDLDKIDRTFPIAIFFATVTDEGFFIKNFAFGKFFK